MWSWQRTENLNKLRAEAEWGGGFFWMKNAAILQNNSVILIVTQIIKNNISSPPKQNWECLHNDTGESLHADNTEGNG